MFRRRFMPQRLGGEEKYLQNGNTGSALMDSTEVLSPLERGKRLSTSCVVMQRLVFVRDLIDVMHELGYEQTVNSLFPLVATLLNDQDASVRQALAMQIGDMAGFFIQSDPDRGYQKVLEDLIPMAKIGLLDRNAIVRRAACDALCLLSSHLRIQDRGASVLTTVLALAHDPERHGLRCLALYLLNGLADILGTELCQQFVCMELLCLGEDPLWHVRRATACNFAEICRVVGPEFATYRLVPAFVILAQDAIWQVRRATAASIVAVTQTIPHESRRAILVPVVAMLLRDEHRTVQLTMMRSLGPFLATLIIPDAFPQCQKFLKAQRDLNISYTVFGGCTSPVGSSSMMMMEDDDENTSRDRSASLPGELLDMYLSLVTKKTKTREDIVDETSCFISSDNDSTTIDNNADGDCSSSSAVLSTESSLDVMRDAHSIEERLYYDDDESSQHEGSLSLEESEDRDVESGCNNNNGNSSIVFPPGVNQSSSSWRFMSADDKRGVWCAFSFAGVLWTGGAKKLWWRMAPSFLYLLDSSNPLVLRSLVAALPAIASILSGAFKSKQENELDTRKDISVVETNDVTTIRMVGDNSKEDDEDDDEDSSAETLLRTLQDEETTKMMYSEDETNLQHQWQLISRILRYALDVLLIRTNDLDLRIAAVKALPETLRVLDWHSRRKYVKFLKKLLEGIEDYSNIFSNSLTANRNSSANSITLRNNKWRLRDVLSLNVAALCELVPCGLQNRKLVFPTVFSLCQDPVSIVRRSAVTSIPRLLSRCCPNIWGYFVPGTGVVEESVHNIVFANSNLPDFLRTGVEVGVISRLLKKFARSPSFGARQTFVLMCDSLIRESPRGFFRLYFLRPLARLSGDIVPNVRAMWANVMAMHIRPRGRLGTNALMVCAALSMVGVDSDREVKRLLGPISFADKDRLESPDDCGFDLEDLLLTISNGTCEQTKKSKQKKDDDDDGLSSSASQADLLCPGTGESDNSSENDYSSSFRNTESPVNVSDSTTTTEYGSDSATDKQPHSSSSGDTGCCRGTDDDNTTTSPVKEVSASETQQQPSSSSFDANDVDDSNAVGVATKIEEKTDKPNDAEMMPNEMTNPD